MNEEIKSENSQSFFEIAARCEEKCVYDWVNCMEDEDEASICKVRENNCFSECT